MTTHKEEDTKDGEPRTITGTVMPVGERFKIRDPA